MITPNLTQLIANTRALAFIVNDDSISDDDITQRLTEAMASLHDLIVGSYEHYAIKQFPFTLAGGNTAGLGLNSIALPSDFYKDNSVDRVTSGSSQPETVHRFEWLDRNRARRREYSLLGSTLVVNPINIAQGNYTLYYTPLAPSFQGGSIVSGATVTAGTEHITSPTFGHASVNVPTTFIDQAAVFDASFIGRGLSIPGIGANNQLPRQITAVPSSTQLTTTGPNYTFLSLPGVPYYISGPSSATWTLGSVTVDDTLLGASIIVAGSNWPGNNGEFIITGIVDSSTVVTNNGTPLTETFASPASVVLLPAGTIYTVPQIYAPWYEYLQVHAAIACRDSIDLPTEAQERKLAALTKRIEAMAANRMEEPGQVALTHRSDGSNEGGYLP